MIVNMSIQESTPNSTVLRASESLPRTRVVKREESTFTHIDYAYRFFGLSKSIGSTTHLLDLRYENRKVGRRNGSQPVSSIRRGAVLFRLLPMSCLLIYATDSMRLFAALPALLPEDSVEVAVEPVDGEQRGVCGVCLHLVWGLDERTAEAVGGCVDLPGAGEDLCRCVVVGDLRAAHPVGVEVIAERLEDGAEFVGAGNLPVAVIVGMGELVKQGLRGARVDSDALERVAVHADCLVATRLAEAERMDARVDGGELALLPAVLELVLHLAIDVELDVVVDFDVLEQSGDEAVGGGRLVLVVAILLVLEHGGGVLRVGVAAVRFAVGLVVPAVGCCDVEHMTAGDAFHSTPCVFAVRLLDDELRDVSAVAREEDFHGTEGCGEFEAEDGG